MEKFPHFFGRVSASDKSRAKVACSRDAERDLCMVLSQPVWRGNISITSLLRDELSINETVGKMNFENWYYNKLTMLLAKTIVRFLLNCGSK